MKKVLIIAFTVLALTCQAQDPSIDIFFMNLCSTRLPQIAARYEYQYKDFLTQLDLRAQDSATKADFFTLILMHKLFTVGTCKDGVRGAILNIPYFWNYNNPNPRMKITVNGELNRYATGGLRIPCRFLGDMVGSTEKYGYPGIEPFASFGWCSEREMAFACLLSIMKFDARVVAPDNHAWTEILLPCRNTAGQIDTILLRVDNTFERFTYSHGKRASTDNMYDDHICNADERIDVESIHVGIAARTRIAKSVDDFLKKAYYKD
ncbi:MAG: hypothetical protein NT040_18575 [Bacteroidetes bacterium]|nr:hypothetical protein [Bacteroidota bacterium]